MTDQEWAKVIQSGASEDGIKSVILAVNKETEMKHANMADVIVACAHMLGQSLGSAFPEIADDMRRGTIALIDGFAMQVAVDAQ